MSEPLKPTLLTPEALEAIKMWFEGSNQVNEAERLFAHIEAMQNVLDLKRLDTPAWSTLADYTLQHQINDWEKRVIPVVDDEGNVHIPVWEAMSLILNTWALQRDARQLRAELQYTKQELEAARAPKEEEEAKVGAEQ